MKHGLAALATLVCACSASLDLPGDLRIACGSDADCPSGLCAVVVGYCVEALDDQPVRLLGAAAAGPSSVLVTFDDALDPATTTDPDRYIITPSLTVSFADYDDDQHAILLATSEQAPGVTYSVAVSGVTDEQGNSLAADYASATFVSFFGGADDSPPKIVAPALHTVVRDSDVLLQWTAIAAAGSYTVEIGTDPSFGTDSAFVNDVVSHTVAAPITEYAFDAAGDVTYFWRVRADVTKANLWTNAQFDRLGSVVFVGCGAPICADGVGNHSRPMASLVEALALARATSINELRLRGDATYDGPLVLDGYGLTVRGGYDAKFLTRDTGGAPSVISGLGSAVIVTGTAAPVVLDGLVLEGRATAATVVVQLRNDTSVELNDIMVRSKDDGLIKTPSVIGVLAENSFGPVPSSLTIRDSVVELGAGVQVIGVRVDEVDVSFENLLVRPRPGAVVNVAKNLDLYVYERPAILEGVTVIGQSELSGDDASTSFGKLTGIVTVRHGSFYMPDLVSPPTGASWNGLDMSGSYGVLERSSIISEVSGVAGYGLRSVALRLLVIRDNVFTIANGTGYHPDGLVDDAVDTQAPWFPGPSFVDNTVVVDVGTAIASTEFESLDVSTNLLVADLCVFEDNGPPPQPSIFLHHNYFGNAFACPNLYDDGTGGPTLTDIADVNAFNGRATATATCSTNAACPYHQHSASNIAVSAATLFVGNSGPPAARNLHLAASAPASVRQSGVDSTDPDDCGFSDHPLPCNGGAGDRADATRTAPRSIGAYEY